MNAKVNFHPILVQASSASAKIYEQCADSERRKIHHLGAALIFTPLLSALVLAYAFHAVNSPPWWALALIFSLWALGIYLFDSMLVAGKSGFLQILIRLAGVVGMTIFHAIALDIQWFEKDLKNLHQADRLANEAHLRLVSDERQDKIMVELSALSERNRALGDSMSASLQSVVQEGNGRGGSGEVGVKEITRLTDDKVQEMNVLRSAEIASNERRIEELKRQIAGEDSLFRQQTDRLPGFSDAGMIDRLGLLHRLIFEQGKPTVILMTLVWMLLAAMLESLPLLSKLSFPLMQYRTLEAEEQALVTESQTLNMRQRQCFLDEKTTLEFKAALRDMRLKAKRLQRREEFGHIYQMLVEDLNMLEKLMAEAENRHDRFDDNYLEIAWKSFERALRRMELAMLDEGEGWGGGDRRASEN